MLDWTHDEHCVRRRGGRIGVIRPDDMDVEAWWTMAGELVDILNGV